MKLILSRRFLGDKYTIGRLSINGNYFCDTLENPNRDANKNGVFDGDEKKIYGDTAIPYGTYKVVMDVVSPKYSTRSAYQFCEGKLPRLLNVPHFEGILIHIGNTSADTAGCILVGENKEKGKVINSTATFKRLYAELKEASDKGEDITIQII